MRLSPDMAPIPMNTKARILSTALATLLLSALPSPQALQATTALQRCTTADGSEVFTDKACSTLGASNAPIPAEMMTRLARTFDRDPDAEDLKASLEAAAQAVVARRSPAAGCARTPHQLQADLHGSLALGDVNRIAESYHWTGLSHQAGQRIMTRLESLAGSPVRAMHFFDAHAGATFGASLYADAGAPKASQGHAGTLQLQLGDDTVRALDLAVERHAGCYFVRF
jgi:hypothetical protein